MTSAGNFVLAIVVNVEHVIRAGGKIKGKLKDQA
jgi:hypothetical protein